jgi:hypothetical protein
MLLHFLKLLGHRSSEPKMPEKDDKPAPLDPAVVAGVEAAAGSDGDKVDPLEEMKQAFL